MFKSSQISDWILSNINVEAGDTISPLKLQKLLYYCQAWHYTIFDQAIFDEKIEAWAHGPVVPSQFTRFAKKARYSEIDIKSLDLELIKFEEPSLQLLNEVMAIYGEHSASYLEELTHQEQPWIQARKGIPAHEKSNEVITLESMKEYYPHLE